MAIVQTNRAVRVLPLSQERRKHQRVKVALTGRYMLQNRQEYPCQTLNMSPGGAALMAEVLPQVGELVVAYIDHVGRLEGMIARIYPSGFSMSISASQRKRDKLAAQLTWLANRNILDLPEDRRHQRVAARDQTTTVRTEAGGEEKCRIADLSVSGVAVITDNRPPIGSSVRVGKAPGRVVRHLESGFAVEFTRIQNADILKDTIVG